MLTPIRRADDDDESADSNQNERDHNELPQNDHLDEQAEPNVTPERVERTDIAEITRPDANTENIAATEAALPEAQQGSGRRVLAQVLGSETDASTSGRKRNRRRRCSKESRRFQKVIDGLNERITFLEKGFRESMGSKSTTIINRKCRYYLSAIERVKREHYMM